MGTFMIPERLARGSGGGFKVNFGVPWEHFLVFFSIIFLMDFLGRFGNVILKDFGVILRSVLTSNSQLLWNKLRSAR